MKILAIESSCDETAAAVVEDGRTVLSSIIASQVDEHKKFGGVVPEIASRMHIECISDITAEALKNAGCTFDNIDAVAVTYAPGLVGALLVGVCFAKAIAFTAGKPLIPVHHIAGHIAANYIGNDLKPPFLALVISGGHTSLVRVHDYTVFEVIGSTGDDAVGESFDKAARVMGCPYPGGVYIDSAAAHGNPTAYKLPKPRVDGFDFSFSGLKTAVINTVHNVAQKAENKNVQINREDLAASFQKTVCDILTEKTATAAKSYGYTKIVLAGGVSANSGIRKAMSEMCITNGFELFMPSLSLCGDNAAMIGAQAYYEYLAGHTADMKLNAYATKTLSNTNN
jgi:N6-L-threonylcarbamoyladenine synthase